MHSITTGANDEFTIDLVPVENVAAPVLPAWLSRILFGWLFDYFANLPY